MPRDKFHVGQRVIWTSKGSEFPSTVRGPRIRFTHRKTGKAYLAYPMLVDGYGTHSKRGNYIAPEKQLRPIYDGDQPSIWAECAWRPAEVRHV